MSRDNADQSRRIHHWRWIYPLASTLFAVLVGTSWLYAGWLENAAYYYAPLVSMFLLISLIAGIIRSRSNYGPYRLFIGVGSCLFAVAMLVVPYGLVWSWYRMAAARYPLPEDARAIEYKIDPIQWNRCPPLAITYETSWSVRELEAFHRHTLKAKGLDLRTSAILSSKVTEGMREVYVDIDDFGTGRHVLLGPLIYGNDDGPYALRRLSDRINNW